MVRSIRNRLACLVVILVAVAPSLAPRVANAQLAARDMGELIEGLREEGLRDLLRHLVETELENNRSIDPTVGPQALISLELLDYADRMRAAEQADSPRAAEALREEGVAIFEAAMDRSRQLIERHFDHEQRPIFQTQLAEQLLFEKLQVLKTNADAFFEFGVTTAEQREAFEQIVPELLELTESADVRFFTLQTQLPREPDHVEKRVDTGIWERMINEFYRVRTQYLLAQASYYAALLPDSHPYYQNLGDNPKIVRQASTPAAERTRLLNQAARSLTDLVTTASNRYPDLDVRGNTVLGRVQSRLEQYAQAEASLRQVADQGRGDMLSLFARLGLAFNDAAREQFAQALLRMDGVDTHPQVTANLLMRLLAIDARHRILLDLAETLPADEQAPAVARAYRPYLDLLNASGSDQSRQTALRNYIYARWEANLPPGADLSTVPSVVVAALVQRRQETGRSMVFEAASLEGRDPDEADRLRDQAAERLQSAIDIASNLLARDGLMDEVAATTRYNQALATFFLDRTSPAQGLKAAGMLVDLARAYPDVPLSEQALIDAVGGVLRPLVENRPAPPGADALYARAMEVLLEQFPTSAGADNERYFYAISTLLPANEVDRAVDVLAAVPATNPDYFAARRELLYALLNQAQQTQDADERAAILNRLAEEARRLRTDVAAANPSPDLAAVAANADGHARLILADLAMAQEAFDQAITLVSGFEDDYPDDDELLRLSLAKRIVLLSRADRLDDLQAEAQRMMRQFPNDAAPIIDEVLIELERDADDALQQAADTLVERDQQTYRERARRIYTTAQKLAGLLLNWADTQGFSDDEMVAFRLIFAKASRLAGDAQGALQIMNPIYRAYPEDPEVMHEYAEALFAVAGGNGPTGQINRQQIVQAGEVFRALIGGLPRDENGDYPPQYWNAWSRWLSILDKTNQQTDTIRLTIRQLQLTDPNLGGEPYKTRMLGLMQKYAR